MSAPRPFVTDPFHPLGSIRSNESFPYICQSVPVTTSKWYVKVCLGKMCISQLRMRSHRNIESRFSRIVVVILSPTLYMLTRIDAKYVAFLRTHLLDERKINRPLY